MPLKDKIQPETFGIIGAMEKEIELLKNAMTEVQKQQIAQLTIYSGKLDGKNVSLCLSGIGKVNATIATTILIEHFAPDCIINTGSAGGVGTGMAIGDVVIGTHIAHHDVDVTAFGYVRGQVPKQPARFTSHPTLIRAAEYAVAQQTHGWTVHRGLIVSGDQFISNHDKLMEIRGYFPDIMAVEMEAAAIAQTCTALDKPYVIIRAISDTADNGAEISFETFLETAAVHSAQMVRQLIQSV